MKLLIHIILVGFLFLSADGRAHRDSIINISKDGSLEGLPLKYSPSLLTVDFDRTGSRSTFIKSIALRLGRNQVVFPPCITHLLKARDTTHIRASASWYHSEKFLPYYLSLEFKNPVTKNSQSSEFSYLMLFNLHTGKLMRMDKVIKMREKDDLVNFQTVIVDIVSLCTSEALDNFSSLSDIRR